MPAPTKTRGERVIEFVQRHCMVPEGAHVGDNMKLLEFQKKFILDVYDNPAGTSRAYLSLARKNGKALALDTRLPTPGGWTTMGEIQVGDVLFDEKGAQCRVIAVTPVQYGRPCFRVRFADGSELVSDADHEWTVYSRSRHDKKVTLTTLQMSQDVILPWSRLPSRVERNYSVDVAEQIDCPDASLLIPPYSLGVWLGDGASMKASFTGHELDAQIAAEVAADGVPVRRGADHSSGAAEWSLSDGVKDRTKDCFKKSLRSIGVLGDKHVPQRYQRASASQRMALLQGLMDTDGYASSAGQCEFVSVRYSLAQDVLQLIRGLGFKATFTEDRASLNGLDCGPRFRIQFWSYRSRPVFRLKRKMNRLKVDPSRSRNRRNYITAIEPIDSVPVRCIQVDSASSLYLAGDGFTPTHNSALIAALALAHLVGPEAKKNSQIVGGARSRDQASIIFKLAEKMVRLSPTLSKIVRTTPSQKTLIGLPRNVEYKAISAEAGTAHGLSPVVAILDEVGQVRGPSDAFVEAIETAQGAHDKPLLLAISTQASSDTDLFSTWLDDAAVSKDPRIVSRVYSAPKGCQIADRAAWQAANPAMGEFRSLTDLEDFSERALRLPSSENSFRWLYLNQRIEATSPFISQTLWQSCGDEAKPLHGVPVYIGLDLSEVADLTAMVMIGRIDGIWHVHPTFWLPEFGIAEKSRKDHAPYEVWAREGRLELSPGRSIDYGFVAQRIWDVCGEYEVAKIAFDPWNFRHLKPELIAAGFRESDLGDEDAIKPNGLFVPFRQGFKSISPALHALESEVRNCRLAHGNHPVLNMCVSNAAVQRDPAGNRKLSKVKSTGRIDGLVATTMCFGVAPLKPKVFDVTTLIA